MLVVLAVVIARFPLPAMGSAMQRSAKADRRGQSLWSHRNLVFGIPAIFIYLIAEIDVADLFFNFVSQPQIGTLTREDASHYLFILWGGMMAGRLIGSVMMRTIPGERVLAFACIGAGVVMLIATFTSGHVAMWSLIAVGLFHSIMFPTIFTRGIKGLGPLTEEKSDLLVMAIAGGSLVIVQGWLADNFELQISFLLTTAGEMNVF